MAIDSRFSMPKDFPKWVHEALRNWHSQQADHILNNLLLARHYQGAQESTARLISNKILLDGIEGLKQTGGDDLADLLQRRFLNQETARQIAYRTNISADIVFQRQRAAIVQLANFIWSQEQALRESRLRLVDTHLEPSSYTRLFGATEKLAALRELMEKPAEPWILALEGFGGIGKTSLADALARELAGSPHFSEIGWVSARRRLFNLSGNIEALTSGSNLTITELVDRLIDQFSLTSLIHSSDSEKWLGLKDYLKSRPCLVVIDNLETVPDYPVLVFRLTSLVNPTKFLLTTRYSLRDSSGIHIYTLDPLNKADTLALVRHEAETRGLPELARAPKAGLEPIHAVTGGNPLAVKLLVGQIHTLSLPVALSKFESARDKPFNSLMIFLHETAWQSLDDDCRRVLSALTLVADSGQLPQIAAAAELDEGRAISCLHHLALLSMVQVSGTLYERRYFLHQLTQNFVAQQVNRAD
ncbi:MAG: NB-ARC domain-containing protein [Chloroflexota bacterium]